MLNQIEIWIDDTLENYSKERISCDALSQCFSGFYSDTFLNESFFVVVDKLPKPNFPELYHAGLGDFIEEEFDGITYKNTYFIKREQEKNMALHFHELVHVAQWKILGPHKFISRYIQEYQENGYRAAPLEEMAYSLQNYYSENGTAIDVLSYVQQKI